LAQPDHAAAQGQPSTEPVRASGGSAPGLSCGSPCGRPAGCHTLPAQAQPQQFLCPAIPEACPPGEGMVWLGRGAFADVAGVAGTRSRDESGARPVRSGRYPDGARGRHHDYSWYCPTGGWVLARDPYFVDSWDHLGGDRGHPGVAGYRRACHRWPTALLLTLGVHTLIGAPERGCALGSGRSDLKTSLTFSPACLRLPLA
jgi:hypothetical protein